MGDTTLGKAPGDTLSRRPAQKAPPVRGAHPDGQVHADAAHHCPQAQGEGRGQGHGRDRRRRSPRGPGGRTARACSPIPGGSRAPDRPRRPDGVRGHQPARHPGVRRPGPDCRLGGASCEEPVVGPVGAANAVDPRAHRKEPARGQQVTSGGRAVHDPGRSEDGLQRELQRRGPRTDDGSVHPRVVGKRVREVEQGLQCRLPGPGADAPFVLRRRRSEPGRSWASRDRPSTCDALSGAAACCWSRPRRAQRAGMLRP